MSGKICCFLFSSFLYPHYSMFSPRLNSPRRTRRRISPRTLCLISKSLGTYCYYHHDCYSNSFRYDYASPSLLEQPRRLSRTRRHHHRRHHSPSSSSPSPMRFPTTSASTYVAGNATPLPSTPSSPQFPSVPLQSDPQTLILRSSRLGYQSRT